MPNKGEGHHCAKLTTAKVIALRKLHYDYGLCMSCAGRLMGVNRQTAYDAITFKTWKHVEDGAVTLEDFWK